MTDPVQITQRLDAVAVFVGDAATRQEIRRLLNAAPDLARSLSRLVVGRGGPRDLAAIRDGIAAASEIAARLDGLNSTPGEISETAKALRRPDPALAQELGAALADELPLFKRDGGFVRAGYLAALDEARALRDESRKVIAQLQVGYADETGVRALKIRHNNVLGYFVEVTAQHGDKLMTAPLNARFIHRQTLAGQVRFTTTELGELEAKIANAADRALGLELETFEQLSASVVAASDAIKAAAEALAVLDVAGALAALAVERDYVRPTVDPSLEFVIEGGRHPVVEQAHQRAVRRQRLQPHGAGRSRKNLAADRSQHGGQVDVPAPERADRRAGADGLASCRQSAPRSACSTGCSPASAPPTIWRAAARPSWSRWWRPRRSSTRPARVRW